MYAGDIAYRSDQVWSPETWAATEAAIASVSKEAEREFQSYLADCRAEHERVHPDPKVREAVGMPPYWTESDFEVKVVEVEETTEPHPIRSVNVTMEIVEGPFAGHRIHLLARVGTSLALQHGHAIERVGNRGRCPGESPNMGLRD